MQEEIRVVITGFKSLDAAKIFTRWYGTRGEEEIENWWEYHGKDKIPYSNSVNVFENTVTLDVDN